MTRPASVERHRASLPVSDQRISVTELARILDCSVAAAWRKLRKGVLSRSGERIHLWHARIGRRLFTTFDAIDEWLDRVREADVRALADEEPGGLPSTRTEPQRRHATERAARTLQASGFDV